MNNILMFFKGINIELMISSFAVVFSLFSIFQSKQKLYAENIAVNRLAWISEFRSLVSDFLSQYDAQPTPSNDFKKTKYQILLLIHGGHPEYVHFMSELEKYSDCEKKIVDHSPIIKATQLILSNSYTRAKRECGVTQRMDSKYSKNTKTMEELFSSQDNDVHG